MHTGLFQNPSEIITALNQSMTDNAWRRVLEMFVPTHLADGIQIQEYAGIDREKLRRTLNKVFTITAGMPPILHALDHSISRPGVRGRGRRIYLLGETGAMLLIELGYEGVHACNLHNDTAIAHALAMLDIHKTAEQMQVTIQTDRELNFGNQVIRPDHMVKLPNGQMILYEIEQFASHETGRRVRESIFHKRSFFTSMEAKNFLPEVRMILNLQPGTREWESTVRWWKNICTESGAEEKLGFRLLVISFSEFLIQPEWDVQTSGRWTDVTVAPAKTHSQNIVTVDSIVEEPYNSDDTGNDDCVVVAAAGQVFNEKNGESLPNPDFGLFNLACAIYVGSHSESHYWKDAAIPYTSIHMLKTLLEKRHGLLIDLNTLMEHGRRGESGGMVVFHMQSVIDCFLSHYHWESEGVLTAKAVANPWGESPPFTISVKAMVDPSPTDIWKHSSEIDRGLGWVLRALFKYSKLIGLNEPKFLS
jgi:hypothetical protein